MSDIYGNGRAGMVAGYLRLSRDEDRKQYVSIENQKLILDQYASSAGFCIDIFYEDDNISGYTLERPGMRKMLEDIDAGLIHTVLAKDLSRLGRHNAKVLLLIEELKERGIRLVLVNDGYDSVSKEEDDILGIKTWYNERYVKDASKKMKQVLHARQRAGTLAARPCFGYEVSQGQKQELCIVEREARVVREIFRLYLEGDGYRKIAVKLNEEGISTPSAMLKQRKGAACGQAKEWSAGMVRDILKNDCYIGNRRMHVRERKTIHGTDVRVPKGEQYVFCGRHEAIVDAQTFQRAQEAMAGRIRTAYKGQRVNGSIFGQCVFCRDCGKRMNLIRREKRRQKTYFVCRTYNARGSKYCSAHTLEEKDLTEAVLRYLQVCYEMLYDDIAGYSLEKRQEKEKRRQEYRKELDAELHRQRKRLELIAEEKIAKMAEDREHAAIWESIYGKLQKTALGEIERLQGQLEEMEEESRQGQEEPDGQEIKAADVLGKVLAEKELTARDVDLLVEKIIADRDGSFEIMFRYGFTSRQDREEAAEKLGRGENILKDVLRIVLEEKQSRGYTSVRHMGKRLKEVGWPGTPKSAAMFLCRLTEMGIVEKTDQARKPYRVAADPEEIQRWMDRETIKGR